MLMLSLLLRYMYGFYGFGHWGAKYWFIGIEEKCGGEQEEIRQRITVWERNPEHLWDMVDYHQAIGAEDVFLRRQMTWVGIAAFLFGTRDQKFTDDDLIDYQCQLGRKDGETCLMEFQPLPSRGGGSWRYGGYQYDGAVPQFLKSRKECIDKCGMDRAKYIRERVTSLACPEKVVVFYGRAAGFRFQAMRDLIVGQSLIKNQPVRVGATCFLLLDHPANNGGGIQRFADRGRMMMRKIAEVK